MINRKCSLQQSRGVLGRSTYRPIQDIDSACGSAFSAPQIGLLLLILLLPLSFGHLGLTVYGSWQRQRHVVFST
jgi:hypothetical protein